MGFYDLISKFSRIGVKYEEIHSGFILKSRVDYHRAYKGFDKESANVKKCYKELMDWLLERWKGDNNNTYHVSDFVGWHGQYFVKVYETCKRKNLGVVFEPTKVEEHFEY